MKFCVTGGTGFIGSGVLANLKSRGIESVILARDSRLTPDRGIDLDLLDPALDWDRLFTEMKPTHLIHLAWDVRPVLYWTSELNHEWVMQSKRMIESFLRCGGKRFTVAGTCAEYDWKSPSPFGENSVENPSTLYGQCKLELLNWIRARFKNQPEIWSWGRIFFPYGSGEKPEKLVPSILGKLSKGEAVELKNPKFISDYIHVADLGRYFVEATLSSAHGVFSFGSGQGLSVEEIAAMALKIYGKGEVRSSADAPPPAPYPIIADTTRLRKFDLAPKISFAQWLETEILGAESKVGRQNS